ncbi:MAG: hypothetical protein IJ960_02455 [Oscillospiraceae bacterium]|nr:hypothetical protein [Oscillospiraceae bacterium]
MSKTICDLWNGEIAPSEHCGAHDPVLNKLIILRQRNMEKLSGSLTDAQKEVFVKYIDCSEEFLLRSMELAFRDGFALGGKLTAKALM